MTTSYVWCDAGPCQARNAGNAVTRAYYGEGEVVPGAPAQRYYYGADQIGSVRRVFASTGSAPAYAYDPYGSALQGTAPLTDFGYAGMFRHADSGLYLTQYRAYDPAVGRWLSRDPLGEASDPAANLYRYVGGNPVGTVDPSGLQFGLGAGAALAYLLTPQPANAPGPCDRIYGNDPLAPLKNAALYAFGGWATDWAIRAGVAFVAARGVAGALSAAAGRAAQKVGAGKGPVYGTNVHTAFREEVKALARSDLNTEISYLNREVVAHGTRGSVRIDVVQGSIYRPTAAFDLKTGSATLTPGRIEQFQSHMPGGSSVPVREIRP